MKIWALSGFLGLPSDWDVLQTNHLEAVDWQQYPLDSLTTWGRAFNQWIENKDEGPCFLMGYSLGGRLALHALLDSPHLWQGAVLISTHPGLSSEEERVLRLQRDLEWGERFAHEEWESLIKAWNQQKIFSADSFHFQRKESDYSRSTLVKALTSCSLGTQANLKEGIASLSIPICWITGGDDKLFCKEAEALIFSNPTSHSLQVKGVGHRVPWVNPDFLQEVDFLRGYSF